MAEIKFKRFFELSKDMLCIAREGYFIEVNHSFVDTLGYSREKLISEPFINFVHPDDLEPTKEAILFTRKKGEIVNFVNRYKDIQGHYKTFSWSAQVDSENEVTYAVARDITEQLNQTNRLKQIEKAMNSETILAVTDKQGIIQEVNDRFCEISGYSREELVGKTHKIINSGLHSREFFSKMWKTISSGEIWSGVIKNKKKTGELYYVQTIITPIRNHEGVICNYVAVRQDITDSIQYQADFTKTLEILNETSAIAKVGGWELDVSSGELTWTDETFRILEVEKLDTQKPMLPEGIELFVPKHQPIIEQAVNRAIELGEPYSLELQAQTAKGNVLWVHTSGKANYQDGKIVTLSGTIQDIHVQKSAEISLDLERQKGIQSSKLASLGELAASMAHEINNPLGIISAYTELMMQMPDIDEHVASKLGIIFRSCERISHIVSNLRKFSRTDETAEHSKCSLAKIVKEAILLSKPRLKREIVSIEYEDNSDPQILCSEIQIEQVVLNLINNSIDAVKSLSNRWIKIELQVFDRVIGLRLTDSGKGIPLEMQDKIFSPFYTTKKADEGTGLGLSIVEGILKDHNATIVYDRDSCNTSFVITFPRAED